MRIISKLTDYDLHLEDTLNKLHLLLSYTRRFERFYGAKLSS